MPVLTPRARRRGVAATAAALLVAGLSATTALPADAASPDAGTVSPTAPTASYTGGPFVAPNVTGTAGTVDCSAPQSCDDYALTVDAPAGYAADHGLTISVAWPSSAADFDVYLLDAAGSEVASAASSADPEVIQVPPNAGTYTVRVVPFAPAGQSYTADIALTSAPADPPVSKAPASGYKNFPAPEGISDAHNAGEPSIGWNPKTGKALYQSYLSTYRVGFTDGAGGTTAEYVDQSASVANGCAVGSTTSLDPILATDRATGRTIESQLLDARVFGSLSCVTSDDGATWQPSQGGGLNAGVDHQTLGWGPYAPGGVDSALRTYPSELYYCSQDIATAYCSTSSDGGTVFSPSVPLYDLQQCGGLHGHVKVGPDGTAYVPNKACFGHPAVVVSVDNGKTWAIRPVPSATPGESDPSVAIADDGTVYLSWNGADNHAFTSVSRDRGEHWTTPYDVGKQLGIQNVAFPAAVAGDSGRAAVAFVGTTTGGNSQETDVFQGVWQLYVAATYDGGKTWKTSNATGADPVQRGSVCTGGTTCGSDRNLLDFIDATIDDDGRVLVGYADGCTADCVTTTNPVDGRPRATATRWRPSPGRARAADARRGRPAAGPGRQRLRKTKDARAVRTSRPWCATSAARASRTPSSASRGLPVRGQGHRQQDRVAAARQVQRVDVVWTAPKKGSHTVYAVADPGNRIRETRESNNKCSARFTSLTPARAPPPSPWPSCPGRPRAGAAACPPPAEAAAPSPAPTPFVSLPAAPLACGATRASPCPTAGRPGSRCPPGSSSPAPSGAAGTASSPRPASRGLARARALLRRCAAGGRLHPAQRAGRPVRRRVGLRRGACRAAGRGLSPECEGAASLTVLVLPAAGALPPPSPVASP